MNKMFIKAHIEKAGEKQYRFLASTSSIDRQGDSIDQSGWELKNFMSNPVILWAHRYDELPLGKATLVAVTENGLEIDVVFAEDEANPKAKQVKKLVDEGILNAVSVGFIAKERNGNVITRAELLEVSIVPVPANQDALALAMKEMDASIQKDFDDFEEETNETVEEKPADHIIEEPVVTEPEVTEEKSGRVLSNKNRKILEEALGSLTVIKSEIEKLLTLSEVATTDGDDDSKLFVVVPRTLVDELKNMIRYENNSTSKLLASLKNL